MPSECRYITVLTFPIRCALYRYRYFGRYMGTRRNSSTSLLNSRTSKAPPPQFLRPSHHMPPLPRCHDLAWQLVYRGSIHGLSCMGLTSVLALLAPCTCIVCPCVGPGLPILSVPRCVGHVCRLMPLCTGNAVCVPFLGKKVCASLANNLLNLVRVRGQCAYALIVVSVVVKKQV